MSGSVVLVRHGETEWSLSGQHTGNTDLPLTGDGRARASELAGVLGAASFDRVLCSPLARARETAALAGYGDVAELCDDLREWDYGEYEGLTSSQIHELDPGWDLWRDGCPGGESPSEVGARADRVLELFAAVGDGSNVLAFAHGHILRVVGARWLSLSPAEGSRFALGVASLAVLGFEHSTRVFLGWNTQSLG